MNCLLWGLYVLFVSIEVIEELSNISFCCSVILDMNIL